MADTRAALSRRAALGAGAGALMCVTMPGLAPGAPLPRVAPEAEGFAADRLQRIDSALRNLIGGSSYAGIAFMVARHGRVVHEVLVGERDIEGHAPLRSDTIFRINSMTKPITAAALMTLYEEGRWLPQDPIAKHASQFDGVQVYAGLNDDGTARLVPAVHPPTLGELLTHTAGFDDGGTQGPVNRFYRDPQGGHLYLSGSLAELVGRLARAPLLYQPGSRWRYSVAANIEGYVIERLSRQPLADFLAARIFAPLGMGDTGFYVPPAKRDRFATLYEPGPRGGLIPTDFAKYGLTYDRPPATPLASAGLVSTLGDYFRFAQMLANGGILDGARVLSPASVELMLANHLAPSLMAARDPHAGADSSGPGLGHGYNGRVVVEPALADLPVGKGTYFQPGAAATWFWIDRENELVCVGMAQRTGGGEPVDLQKLSMALVYQALAAA